MSDRKECPWCGRKLVTKRDGMFQWKACPAVKVCGWTVFKAGYATRTEWEELDSIIGSASA